jgi:glycosyltransferase involved in cell wall biosynthesis
MDKRYLLYVGYFQFPWGQAASRRVYANAKSLTQVGYDVVVASGSSSPEHLTVIRENDKIGDISYIGLNTLPDQSHSTLKKIFTLIFDSSKRTLNFIYSLPHKPDYIILYGGYTPYLIRLLPWCKKNNVPIIADIVEWYSPSPSRFGKFNFSYLNVELAQRVLFHMCDGIIPISSYLEKYYKDKGCITFRVPPTVDIEIFPKQPIPLLKKAPLRLVYAGSPGDGKDLLKNLVDAVLKVNDFGKRVDLQILGPSFYDVKKICNLSTLPRVIKPLGRIPQHEVPGYVSTADFSLLLRKPQTNTQAGFPTKFVESMACGTPVIANITSDLGNYLDDGVNGFICQDYSVQALVNVLKTAMEMPKEKITRMHRSAFETAKKHFDYRNYSLGFIDFLEKVSRNYKNNLEK